MSFIYYGRQRIERRTSVLMRELVTEGFVKRVPRTENNPHGLLIVNWRTILNKDIDQKTNPTIKHTAYEYQESNIRGESPGQG